jgi:ribulose bisphosphate carboxylase small subunit
MDKAIRDATMDLDGQAAGKEYADLKKYATENWDKLSPDAKAKFGVYEKYAQAAQAKGQTGIPVGQYNKMLAEMKTAGYQDQSAGAAIEGLKQQPKPVSGAAMDKAILSATEDLDGQAAGKEFADLKKYATENWSSLSPDAKAKFRVYEKFVNEAKAKGQTGIDLRDYARMRGEMSRAGYKDASVGQAMESLRDTAGRRIDGAEFQRALLAGTKDLDGQAAGREYADVKKFVTENWDTMTPAARRKFEVYEKYAQAAQARGQTGISQADYDRMTREMSRIRD